MASTSQTRLELKVARVAEAALADRHFVTVIDVLVGIGWLTPPLVEDWRRGRIPYLEQVVGANLRKISTAMRYLSHWAEQRGLNPRETMYVSWTRDRRPLRFSKTGDPNTERAYRTHWVSPELREAKHQRLAEKQSQSSKLDGKAGMIQMPDSRVTSPALSLHEVWRRSGHVRKPGSPTITLQNQGQA